jgi:hypothetical protein
MDPVLPLAVGNRAGYAQNSCDRRIVEHRQHAAAVVARFLATPPVKASLQAILVMQVCDRSWPFSAAGLIPARRYSILAPADLPAARNERGVRRLTPAAGARGFMRGRPTADARDPPRAAAAMLWDARQSSRDGPSGVNELDSGALSPRAVVCSGSMIAARRAMMMSRCMKGAGPSARGARLRMRDCR